ERAVDRACVPGRADHAHLRGDERGPAHGHRRRAARGPLSAGVGATRPTGASTPGGHRLIRAAWSLAGVLLVVGAGVAAFRGVRLAVLATGFALALFVLGSLSSLVRHFRFLRDVSRAEDALRRGDHARARAILAPLIEMYGHVAVVQRAAGRALYELGDP